MKKVKWFVWVNHYLLFKVVAQEIQFWWPCSEGLWGKHLRAMGMSLEIMMVISRVKNIPLLANLAGIKSGDYKQWLTCCAGTMPGCYGITDEGACGLKKEGWSWVSHIKVRFSGEMVSKTKRMSLPVKRGWRHICFCALDSYLWCTNSPVKNNWKGQITNQTVDQAETETAV